MRGREGSVHLGECIVGLCVSMGDRSAGFSPKKKKINTVAPSDRMLMRKPDCLTKGKLPLGVVFPHCALRPWGRAWLRRC